MLNNSKDMPKIVKLDKDAAKRWKGQSMVIASPIVYDEFINKIPREKLVTTDIIRKAVAKKI